MTCTDCGKQTKMYTRIGIAAVVCMKCWDKRQKMEKDVEAAVEVVSEELGKSAHAPMSESEYQKFIDLVAEKIAEKIVAKGSIQNVEDAKAVIGILSNKTKRVINL